MQFTPNTTQADLGAAGSATKPSQTPRELTPTGPRPLGLCGVANTAMDTVAMADYGRGGPSPRG